MKRKIIFLLGIVFLLSGCSATYNLNINDNNTVNENATIKEKKKILNSKYDVYDDETASLYANQYLNDLSNTWKNKYNLNGYIRNDTNDLYQYSKNDTFNNIFDIKNSKVLNIVFSNINVTNKDKIYYIKLQGFNKEILSNISDFDIKFTLPYLVIESNGSVEGNTCRWSFTNNNVSDIYISYDSSKKYNEVISKNEDKKPNYKTIIIVCASILAVILLIYIVLKSKFNKSNSID